MKQQQSDLYDIQLTFQRGNSTYKPQQTVTGIIKLIHKQSQKYKVDVGSLIIKPIGKIALGNRQNNKKIQSIFKQIPVIDILQIQPIELAKNKTLTQSSDINFRFKLAKAQHKYVQTYFGVFINITYDVQVIVKLLNNPNQIKQSFPFYVQVPRQGRDTITDFVYPKKKQFMIRSQDIKGNKVPKFKIRGELQSQICYFTQDINGIIVIDQAQSLIRSIDFQMYRVEKISTSTETVVQRTQIQMIQMCDGNVTRNLQLPMYMILPRYYSCPSVKYMWCQVDFQIDLLIIFRDGFKVTVNIPIKLIRS